MEPQGRDPILIVDNLGVAFTATGSRRQALDALSFRIDAGETLVVVGESGSGKSVTGLAVMGLLPKHAVVTGRMTFQRRGGMWVDLANITTREHRALAGDEIAMIFQEPMACLNPVLTVADQLVEPLVLHRREPRRHALNIARDMLRRVGIADPAHWLDAYPHQLSGGMRQRMMIAMALMCHPKLLVADEPTTALDVTVQAHILDLLRRIQDEFGMAMLFITHDFGVVAEIGHRSIVLYAGQAIEQASVDDLLDTPHHPYTRGLLATVPRIAPNSMEPTALRSIPGQMPDLADLPRGCLFHSRCEWALPGNCDAAQIGEVQITRSHMVRCVRWPEFSAATKAPG